MTEDLVDRVLRSWADARPDVDLRVLQITGRLRRIGPLLARRQEAVFDRYELNRGDVDVLSALRVAPPPHRLSPTRLGRGLMPSSAGITSRIDRLEAHAFVRRLPDREDRRSVLVELTSDGLEVVDAAVAALAFSDRQLMERLDPSDAAVLVGLLRRLLAGLELPDG